MAAYVTFPEVEAATWSKIDSASRMAPSALRAITLRAALSTVMFSCDATYPRWSTMSCMVIREKSYIWQRDRIVGIILCFSVVASMKITYDGGSSSVLRNALKAAGESICTSSTINTRYCAFIGGTCTCSVSERISSTPLFDAASSSTMLSDVPRLNSMHDWHSLHASPVGVRC